MGRRALKTGDLVKAKGGSTSLWETQDDSSVDSRGIVVLHFRFGIVLGMVDHEWMPGKHVTRVLVHDSETMVSGWCDKKYLQRAE